ncbi:basic proline-rich protein-like [Loxodonta africana]|uniref:basic proline-rich protein-like n=1 Tax=Loxodonta africana TaxID=9785 RepID=UPI0030D000E7
MSRNTYRREPPALRGRRNSRRCGVSRGDKGRTGPGRAQVRQEEQGSAAGPEESLTHFVTAAAGSWELNSRGHHPGRAHPRPGLQHPPRASPLAAAPPPLPRARAPAAREKRADTPNLARAARAPQPAPPPLRIPQSDPDPLPRLKFPTPNTPGVGASASLRQFPCRDRVRQGPKTRRLLAGQTRLYVCGAGAHAQTPSFLRPLSLPPPPVATASSSRRQSPLLLLRSGAGPSSPNAARDWGIRGSRGSRRRALLATRAPSPPDTLPQHPPTHPPRLPTPANPTSRSFERRRLQSLHQPVWPPTPPRKEPPPPPPGPREQRGEDEPAAETTTSEAHSPPLQRTSRRPPGSLGRRPLPPRGRVPSRGACPEGGKCSGSMAASDGAVPGLPLPPPPPRPGRAPRGPGVSARPPAPRCRAHRTGRPAAAPLRASPPQPRPAFPPGAAAASPGGLKGSPSKAVATGPGAFG